VPQQMGRMSDGNTSDVTGTSSTGHSLCGFSSCVNLVMNIAVASNSVYVSDMQWIHISLSYKSSKHSLAIFISQNCT
jgi:hypothetical protein